MTDQNTHTIASVKQSMQRHIYDLKSSLAIARAATEGRLPEAYSDPEEAINLMIRQAHVFSDKLVSELENMDALEGMGRVRDAAASGPAVNDTPNQVEAETPSESWEDDFYRATGTASALFDLLTSTASGGDVEGLHKHTLVNTGISGFDAIQNAKEAFNDLLSLYIAAKKVPGVQS